MSGFPTTLWLWRHPTLGRLICRGPVGAWISRRVWAEFAADPTIVAEIERGKADLAAGRRVPLGQDPE